MGVLRAGAMWSEPNRVLKEAGLFTPTSLLDAQELDRLADGTTEGSILEEHVCREGSRTVAKYQFEADGHVTDLGSWQIVAFFEDDGRILDKRHGHEIGFIESDGRILDGQVGGQIGFVSG